MSPIMTGEVSPVPSAGNGNISVSGPPPGDNPSYKRCHLCVRIFSTKVGGSLTKIFGRISPEIFQANLSSHIRHVHMGEAKHSRVKSIPCPHCNKMFSRKVRKKYFSRE